MITSLAPLTEDKIALIIIAGVLCICFTLSCLALIWWQLQRLTAQGKLLTIAVLGLLSEVRHFTCSTPPADA